MISTGKSFFHDDPSCTLMDVFLYSIQNSMRYAFISDIHSNLEALTKALEIIDDRSADKIICLGDIVGYGANPNECIELVRLRCSTVIRGNHDEAILDVSIAERFTEDARSAILWTCRHIGEENISYLRTLPLSDKKEDILLVHSSPCHPQEWEYILDEDTAVHALHCYSETLCFIGHTHTPAIFSTGGRVKSLIRGNRYLVNVGSIGQPRDHRTDLSFGFFDTETWEYENIRSSYDVAGTVQKIFNSDLPPRLGHRLLLGV
jgi:predicted phosphodiesterase